jgi:glycosyltransferase involved in cell wall biosynthesis
MAYFSILIANYNNGKYLPAALDSVLAQTFQDWEIVVVDDASTDDSLKVIGSYQEKGYPIKLHRHQNNEGCGGTKNDCVAFSTGVLCAFLDPDDALTEDALETMVVAHREHPEVSLVYSRFYVCDTALNVKQRADWIKPIPKGENNLLHDQARHFASFKRAAYDQTDGIGRRYISAEDKDLYYKLEEIAPFYFVDKTLYFYRENRKGMSQFHNYVTAQDNHLDVIDAALQRRTAKGLRSLTPREYNMIRGRIYLQRAELLILLGFPKIEIWRWLIRSWRFSPFQFNLLRIKYFILSWSQRTPIRPA